MSDLGLNRQTLRTIFSDRMAIDVGDFLGDLDLKDGLDNVAQAIQNRLLTGKGEIHKLGHASYGSELHRLIGEPITWKTKARAEMYIQEALKQEQRVEEVVDIQFPEGNTLESRFTLAIVLVVKVVNYDEQLKLSLAINLKS